MSFMKRLKLRALRFSKDDRGAMPVEGALASIFLAWWYVASVQFFDAYKQKNINQKASYAVADLLSRETGSVPGDPNSKMIDLTYMQGLARVFDYMTFSKKPTWLRVTSVYWDGAQSRYEVAWSITTGTGHSAMTDAKLAQVKDKIPNLRVGDTIILMETFAAYEPMFNLSMASYKGGPDAKLEARWDKNFITTRPRFASCIPWEDQGCGDDGTGAGGGTGDDVPPVIEPDDPNAP